LTLANDPSSRFDRFFAVLALIGLGSIASITIALHFLSTGYNPVTQVVSDYAIGNYSSLMMIGFLTGGIGNISLGLTLSHLASASKLHKIGASLLLVAGLALFIVGLFPTDLEGSSVTTHGIIHSIVSQIIFITWPVGMLIVSYRLGRKRFTMSFLALVGAGVFFALDKALSLNIGGLSERIFILVLLGCSLLNSYVMFRNYFFA
jgi:hypothetical membrane protein